jgi:WD40 repeat protein
LRIADAPQTATEFVDPPPLLDKLEELKKEIRLCGRPVRSYPCEWTGNSFVGMDEFGRLVLDDLWSGILRDERYVSKKVWRQVLGVDPTTDARYTDESESVGSDLAEKLVALAKPAPISAFDEERKQMGAFSQNRLRWFQGRKQELKALSDFSTSKDEKLPRLAAVVAISGQGKSALLAKFSTLISQSSTFIITHFVGATDRSSDANAIVERILTELDRSGITWPAEQQEEGQEPKGDFDSMCLRLAQRLGDYAGDRRIVILLDALNQLIDGHTLQWLPDRLGPGVRIIVSCVEVRSEKPDAPELRVLRALDSRQTATLRVPLEPLTEDDVRSIVVEYLREYCKELDREQLDALCSLPQARNPLYLLVMLGEIRTIGGNNATHILVDSIAALALDYPDTVSLFRWVLRRLEVFGAEAVRWWCLYLAHGRVGMASRELADLLTRKLGVDAAFTALRIERGLRRYLQRRGPQLDFFHGHLRQAVIEQYNPQEEAVNASEDIAIYFSEQDNFLESLEDQRVRAHRLPPTPRPVNQRKVEELVYQRLAVLRVIPLATKEFENACEALELLLSDILFLEAKTEAGMVFRLAGEFAAAVNAIPEGRPHHRLLRLTEEALRRDIHFIAKHPTTLFQCLWNLCWWYDSLVSSRHYLPEAMAPIPVKRHDGNQNEQVLSDIAEAWRVQKERNLGTFFWLRTLRPPLVHLGTAQRSVLTGHTDRVNAVAVSPDGQWIASGSADRSIRIWDSSTGQEVGCIIGHQGDVMCVCFTPDSRNLVSGSTDETVRIWEWESKRQIKCLSGHGGSVNGVAVSPDGLQIVSASGKHEASNVVLLVGTGMKYFDHENSVRVWDANTGGELHCFTEHEHDVYCVAFSPDGRYIASGSGDKTIRMWSALNGALYRCLRGHKDAVFSLDFSPDSAWIVSGGRDNAVMVWNVRTGQLARSLKGQEMAVFSVAVSVQGQIIAGSTSETIFEWDKDVDNAVRVFRGHDNEVRSVAFAPNGIWFVSGGWDQTVRVWNTREGGELRRLSGHLNVNCLSYSPQGDRIVSGGGLDDNTIRVWDTNSGEELMRLQASGDFVYCVTFSPDGRFIACGTGSGHNGVILWDAQNGKEIRCFLGHEAGVTSVSFSPDSK